MNVRTHIRSSAGLLALAGMLCTLSAANADPQTAKSAPASSTLSSPVVVKLGTATLEEYQHRNPAERTLLVRDASNSQTASTVETPHTKHGA